MPRQDYAKVQRYIALFLADPVSLVERFGERDTWLHDVGRRLAEGEGDTATVQAIDGYLEGVRLRTEAKEAERLCLEAAVRLETENAAKAERLRAEVEAHAAALAASEAEADALPAANVGDVTGGEAAHGIANAEHHEVVAAAVDDGADDPIIE